MISFFFALVDCSADNKRLFRNYLQCSHIYNYKVVCTPTTLWNTCISCILLCKYTEWALCMLLILQGCLSTSEPMHRPLFSRRTLQGMVLSAVSQHWLSRFQLGRLSGWHIVEGHPFENNRIKRFCFKNDKNSKMKTKTEKSTKKLSCKRALVEACPCLCCFYRRVPFLSCLWNLKGSTCQTGWL